MNQPGGTMPSGDDRQGARNDRVGQRRIVATERREGAVRNERRPHHSDQAETGRRKRSRHVAMMAKLRRSEPRQDADQHAGGRMPDSFVGTQAETCERQRVFHVVAIMPPGGGKICDTVY